MQIRLTVLGPRSGQTAEPQDRPAVPRGACDVLVTAPAGTALATVASGLAAAVAGGDGPVVLYAESERLDAQRCTLGEPPLIDGAVLSLGSPAEPGPELAGAAAQLHVVAGPDAGGVHLLHGGQIRVGRSAEADVPLDDPDVSRLHCAVTLTQDGQVTVTDLGSTNGTTVDGREITDRPVRLPPGSLLRLGESALRLTAGDGAGGTLPTAPDGEGHVRVRVATGGDVRVAASSDVRAAAGSEEPRSTPPPEGRSTPPEGAHTPSEGTHHAYGSAGWGAAGDDVRGGAHGPHGAHGQTSLTDVPLVPQQGGAPDAESTRMGTPTRGTTVPRGLRKRGGLSAWARRLTGSRDDEYLQGDLEDDAYGTGGAASPPQPAAPTPEDLAVAAAARTPESWPDPAALLLTALGPGPRLWERGPGHPEALAVRLGTVDRANPDERGLLPAVPVTVSLREAGALGLAGPRERLTGLARAVVAQLAALHSPDALEIVLLSTDRTRPTPERAAEWSWLGWLPHLRPTHGQDCRLLLAYDREQAAARTEELLRRLADHVADRASAAVSAATSTSASTAAAPSDGSLTDDSLTDSSLADSSLDTGPRTVVVVDGDPGSAGLREAVARLAREGATAGIHVVCLAETPAASPASPVSATYEAACSVSPAFRACGAVALLSGDVATALRLLRTADGQPAGHGTIAAVDAVSQAWAERFARALAPFRTDGAPGEGHARVSAPLPQMARLLDELGLARATPASLMARWAAAADDQESLGGRAWTVLGAGPRGPVVVDLAAEGPHVLAEGPSGSGRTELLRSIAASLAAAERPDRLGIVLIDGRDTTGSVGSGTNGANVRLVEGLAVCTDLPHVTTHLAANDPVRMREFAQSLTAELKRRAELLGRLGFAEWHANAPLPQSGGSGMSGVGRSVGGGVDVGGGGGGGGSDLDPPPSSTMRLRPAASRKAAELGPPLPRLVVLVDDFDALLSPALGSPGRPAAGSVVRALEAVARDGGRLGVHLVATTARSERTPETELGQRAALRIALDAASLGPEEPAPGRGELRTAEGRVSPFQAGRVTGRIPRTSTLRPTVVPLEWERMGDPPARRPVRELGNGPTDLALLASALERAARSVAADQVPSLL